MPILDDRLDQPCTNGHPEAQRISALGALQFRSALICADMADAAYANDPQWMLRTCMRLREFIVDTFNPFFECENADILGMLDAHVVRLRRVIASRERAVS